MNPIQRRDVLRALGALAPAAIGLRADAALLEKSYSESLPGMLPAWLAERLNELAAKWDAERASIRSAGDLEARNRFVRETVRKMIHGLPERTPLKATVVRRHERKGYRIEDVTFESRPDFLVTASLYVPTDRTGPLPGIISPCGHYPAARLYTQYQAAYLNLVKSGFVVLAYDPIGQGERRQYWDPKTGVADISDPVYEHSMPGQLLLLMGEDLTQYRVWDGMRAIDYLLTREEVDGKRIGCMGHSGGGTMTMFLSVVDERIRCAVINEGGTGHRWPVKIRPGSRFGPSDVEQNLFPAAVYGIDQCDLHVAIAPRPLLATIEHRWPSFELAAEHVQKRYAQLGVPDHFSTAEANAPHAFTDTLRLATTDWFCRWFYGHPGPAAEPALEIEEPQLHYCTEGGSVRYAQRGQTIFSHLAQRGAQLPPAQPVPSAAEFGAFQTRMRGEIRRLLRIDGGGQPPVARRLGSLRREGCRVDRVEFLTEPGIYVPAWIFAPERKASGRVVVHAAETGKEDDCAEFGVLEQLARRGRTVLAIDVRGVGETALPDPENAPPFAHLFSTETAAVYMAWFMDRCLFGMRVFDLLRSVDYALSLPEIDPSGVDVIGKGAGALWAMFAAAMDSRIRAVVAERGLISYACLTEVDRYTHSAGVFVRDVLTSFDLPQVAAAMAGRPLALLSPVGPMKQEDVGAARRAYEFTRQTYAAQGAAAAFTVQGSRMDQNPADDYLRLLSGKASKPSAG